VSSHRGVRWALLYGNFTIGCGVMVTAGALNDLVDSLQVSVAVGGQLIAVAAVMMAVGAPVLAALVSGIDRRRLLTFSLVWFAAGHALSALMPSYAALLPVRVLSVLGAAVFTPQAAAAIGVMVPPHERGRAITFVFLGWSISSVLGMPVHAYIGEAFGWRWAFGLVGLLSAGGAWWVWRAMPDGVRPPAMSLAAWREVFTHPALMATIAVTALSSAGQFTLFSYIAPYYRQVLSASPLHISLMFLWFGAVGVLGNVLVSRHIDRLGAARMVAGLLCCMALSLLAWPLATGLLTMVLVIAPWAFGCFSSNSAQQARLSLAAPALTPALVALNSSAMYVGQALGASSGGAILSQRGFDLLHWVGLAWMAAAIGLSLWAARRMAAQPLAPAHG
jgi:predicted MFS family arabinose efflux permease